MSASGPKAIVTRVFLRKRDLEKGKHTKVRYRKKLKKVGWGAREEK